MSKLIKSVFLYNICINLGEFGLLWEILPEQIYVFLQYMYQILIRISSSNDCFILSVKSVNYHSSNSKLEYFPVHISRRLYNF